MATRRKLRTLTVGDRLLDRAIIHAHDLERYKNGVVRRILATLNRTTYPRIVDLVGRLDGIGIETWGQRPRPGNKDFAKIQRQIRRAVAKGIRKAAAELNGELDKFARAEVSWQIQAIEQSIPVQVSLATPTPAFLQAVRLRRPFQGRLLKDWYKSLDTGLQTLVRDSINHGIVQGQSVPEMTRALRGTRASGYTDGILQGHRRHAETIVRTATSHIANGAKEALYKANPKVVKRERFTATLDAQTTIECAGLDGEEYEVGNGPRPPIHFG